MMQILLRPGANHWTGAGKSRIFEPSFRGLEHVGDFLPAAKTRAFFAGFHVFEGA